MVHSKQELLEAMCTLNIKRGDILIVDATVIDVYNIVDLQIPGVDFDIPIICAIPTQGDTITEALRTCDLALLKEVVANMEAENAQKEQSTTPRA